MVVVTYYGIFGFSFFAATQFIVRSLFGGLSSSAVVLIIITSLVFFFIVLIGFVLGKELTLIETGLRRSLGYITRLSVGSLAFGWFTELFVGSLLVRTRRLEER